ncbi:MAG: thermonuclease family protein [Candidatus Thiodiazotropha endolucinida]
MAFLIDILRRAPLCGAFFLSALIIPSLSDAVSCSPCGAGLLEVSSIYDGDTLRLEDGRRIRLIGVNTPELGQGTADEPNAEEAKHLLEILVKRSGGSVRICMDAERRDRYGRLLAHLYDHRGDSINRRMLKQGAGYLVAVPPNLRNHECYKHAEKEARKGEKGVWRLPIGDASKLNGNETGFHILNGYIKRVGQSRTGIWLNLDGGLALRITWNDWEGFGIDDPESLLYTSLEVRGWIYQRNGNQRIRVRHTSSIHWLERE